VWQYPHEFGIRGLPWASTYRRDFDGGIASKVWLETVPEAIVLGRWHEVQDATSYRCPECFFGLATISPWQLPQSARGSARSCPVR